MDILGRDRSADAEIIAQDKKVDIQTFYDIQRRMDGPRERYPLVGQDRPPIDGHGAEALETHLAQQLFETYRPVLTPPGKASTKKYARDFQQRNLYRIYDFYRLGKL